MNATDVRVIGASALTAAAVSLITVAVAGMRHECKPPVAPVTAPPAAPAFAPAPAPAPTGALPPGDLAILGLETADPMGDAVVIAEVLGPVMRNVAIASGHAVAPGRETDLATEKSAANCATKTEEACLTTIGQRLAVDRLVYGRLAIANDSYEIKLDLFDVKAKRVVKTSTRKVPAKEAEAEGLDLLGKRLITMLLSTSCDAEKLKEDGMGHINAGMHQAALASFEASLGCARDAYVVQLAFMSACSAQHPEKAKLYYAKLTPAQQTKFAQICIRNGTAYK